MWLRMVKGRAKRLLSCSQNHCSNVAAQRGCGRELRCCGARPQQTAALTDLLLNEAFSDRRSRHWILPDEGGAFLKFK